MNIIQYNLYIIVIKQIKKNNNAIPIYTNF